MIERIELELTNTCNLKCPLCARQIHKDYKNDKFFRSIDDIIEQLDTYQDLKYITIAGPTSEPTLYPDLFKLIQYLNEKNIEVSLFINGDTHDDLYYRKLGVVFKKNKGNIYLTICGSNQSIHEIYRVNSNFENIIKRYKILNIYCNVVLTWIIFNYNYIDYKENIISFRKQFKIESFNSLPVAEHYNLKSHIRMIDESHDKYKLIDRESCPEICLADKYNFRLIDYKGNVYPCGLYKIHGYKNCFECSDYNQKLLRDNKIFQIAECENNNSEKDLKYESNKRLLQ